jgi:hypothetical protein
MVGATGQQATVSIRHHTIVHCTLARLAVRPSTIRQLFVYSGNLLLRHPTIRTIGRTCCLLSKHSLGRPLAAELCAFSSPPAAMKPNNTHTAYLPSWLISLDLTIFLKQSRPPLVDGANGATYNTS